MSLTRPYYIETTKINAKYLIVRGSSDSIGYLYDSLALVSGVRDRTAHGTFAGEENPRIRAVMLQVTVEQVGKRKGLQSQA